MFELMKIYTLNNDAGCEILKSVTLPGNISHYIIDKKHYNSDLKKYCKEELEFICNDMSVNAKELFNYVEEDDLHLVFYKDYEFLRNELKRIRSNAKRIVFVGLRLTNEEMNNIKNKYKNTDLIFKTGSYKKIEEKSNKLNTDCDPEIDELLNRIKAIKLLLPDNIKNMIDEVINKNFENYLESLKKEEYDNTPRIGSSHKFGEEIYEMGYSKRKLIINLNYLLFELNTIKEYTEKIKYLDNLEKLVYSNNNEDSLNEEKIINEIVCFSTLFDNDNKALIKLTLKEYIEKEKVRYLKLISDSFNEPENKMTLEPTIIKNDLLENLTNYKGLLEDYYSKNKSSIRLISTIESGTVLLENLNGINGKLELIRKTIGLMHYKNNLMDEYNEIISRYKDMLKSKISNYNVNLEYSKIEE